jgi:hypothetical protein
MIANVAVAVIKTLVFHDKQVAATKTGLFKFLVPQKAALLAVRANFRSSVASAATLDVKIGTTSLLSTPLNLFPIGTPTTPVAALVALDVGNVDAGVHRYKVTYESVKGETIASAASVAITNDGSHCQNTVTIPVGPSGTIYRHIYRTQANGSTYNLLATILNNTTTTYTDNTTDATIVAAAEPPSVNSANDGTVQSAVLADTAGVAMPAASEVSIDIATLTGTSIDDVNVQVDYLPVE